VIAPGWRTRALRDPVLGRLLAVGTGSLPVYGLVAFLSGSFRFGEGHAERPILAVLGLLAVAWVGYAAALIHLLGTEDGTGGNATEPRRQRVRLAVVLAFSLLYRLILLPSVPIQEIDYYRYLWDGRVVLNGIDPFRFAPAELDRLGPAADSSSAPGRLWRLSRESDSVRTIFERIHHREVPTIYPPASQAVFALAAWLTPGASPLRLHVLILKGLLVAFDFGVVLALAGLLVRVGRPGSWCLAYGWCPLALKEVANTGHLDAIAVFFTVLAAFWLAGVPSRSPQDRSVRRAVLGAAALGAATLAKGYPLILVPLVGAFLVARLRARAVAPAIVFILVLLAGYAPFLGGGAQVESGATPEHSPWAGLRTFLARWQKNDFLFMLVHENLRPPVPGRADRWFVLTPAPLRTAIDSRLAAAFVGESGPEPAFLLTQALMGTILVMLIARWTIRTYRDSRPETLLRGVALSLVWGWLLSATPHPWYLTWSLPFLVFEGRRSWFLLSGLAFAYYLRYWLEYQALPGGPPAIEAALERFDYGIVWFEYLPFFAALALESLRRTGRLRVPRRLPGVRPPDQSTH